ncbi:MAG: hypothetical protein V4754_00400 [Pseudomonadota bacterium]
MRAPTAAPHSSGIPTGPYQQDSEPGAGVRQLGTYPDLLKSEADAAMFDTTSSCSWPCQSRWYFCHDDKVASIKAN